MSITLAVPKETAADEKRVSIVPAVAQRWIQQGYDVCVEQDAGAGCFIDDQAYDGARVVGRDELFGTADIVFSVQIPYIKDIQRMRAGSLLVGLLSPHSNTKIIKILAEQRITSFAMELIPRISRAQAMDALSSQATAAGYAATIIAAGLSQRFFPMLTTAAGTIRPAKVLIIGAGVAGLQAIATARRLGAIVEAYDVRSATREQVQSLGARFVGLPVAAESSGGYARELTEDEKQQQQSMLSAHVAAADVVITTAAIPGRQAPVIITSDMVDNMHSGAVIVDLAAETGGNCAYTQVGKRIKQGGVIIYGPKNLPSCLAEHASDMYARNLFNFSELLIHESGISLDWEDEIIAGSIVTHEGKIIPEAIRAQIEGNAS